VIQPNQGSVPNTLGNVVEDFARHGSGHDSILLSRTAFQAVGTVKNLSCKIIKSIKRKTTLLGKLLFNHKHLSKDSQLWYRVMIDKDLNYVNLADFAVEFQRMRLPYKMKKIEILHANLPPVYPPEAK
jgi:hypothetical protein